MSADLSASQTVEEPLDLIRLSLDERIYVKCRGGRELRGESTTRASPSSCSAFYQRRGRSPIVASIHSVARFAHISSVPFVVERVCVRVCECV
jgi:hypothetical protein